MLESSSQHFCLTVVENARYQPSTVGRRPPDLRKKLAKPAAMPVASHPLPATPMVTFSVMPGSSIAIQPVPATPSKPVPATPSQPVPAS